MPVDLTFKQVVLIQRLTDYSDLTVAEDLWGTLTDEPFDGDQPPEEVLKKLADLVNERINPDPEEKVADPSDAVLEILKQATQVVNTLAEAISPGTGVKLEG